MLENSNNAIAVLDSGIGGISVLRQLMKHGGNYIYVADNAHMPYGSKTADELTNRLDTLITMIRDRYRVSQIVVACNTASSVIGGKYDNVITMRFNPQYTYLTTKLTRDRLGGDNIIADNNLATLIERYIHDRAALDKIVREHVKKYRLNKLDCLVLGCTHYELVKDIFMKYCPNTQVYNNSEFILSDIDNEGDSSDTNVYFITTRNSKEYSDRLVELALGV